MKWPEWLTYCPRGKTRAEWHQEFERDHAPKYDREIADRMKRLKSGSYFAGPHWTDFAIGAAAVLIVLWLSR